MAELYRAQGRYAEAEPLFKRALAINEKALGPEHPRVATSLNNLANLYRAQGKSAEAELLVKRSLAIWEKILPPDDLSVAPGLNLLGFLYSRQGKYAEAEAILKRSLAIREKTLGPEHPRFASTLSDLASLYYLQGNYAEAEPLYKRALAIAEKAPALVIVKPETVHFKRRHLQHLLADEAKVAPAIVGRPTASRASPSRRRCGPGSGGASAHAFLPGEATVGSVREDKPNGQ